MPKVSEMEIVYEGLSAQEQADYDIYILTDTGPSIYFWPPEARMLNFKLGVNFMMGNPNKKKKKVKVYDMPLVD